MRLDPHASRIGLGGFLAVLFGAAAVTLGLALTVVAVLYVRARREHRVVAVAPPEERTNRVDSVPEEEPDLPTVTRHVPTHSLRMLEGCSDDNLTRIAHALADAIDEGSPEYNKGHFVDCYKTYVSASLALEHTLPPACSGPVEALSAGRLRARGLDRVSEQAWAMRDAFDGLLDVISRNQDGLGPSL